MKYNAAAKHAISFVSNLTLVDDRAGEPFKPETFQKEILAVLFQNRNVKRALLFLPRKQAKTFLVACVVIYWLLGRGLKGQQCLSIANDREQAALLFNMCRSIIEADPELSDLCEIVPSTKRIVVPSTNSFYVALSSESTTKTGFNPSLVIIDEAQDIRDADLIKNITTGRTAREDYLTLFVGTAGKRKDTPFFAEYEYAKKWRAGIVENKSYHAWIYEALTTDDDGNEIELDWKDEKTWRKTMPAYGKFCRPAAVKEEFELALKMPHKELDFKQYNLNLWQIYSGTTWVSDAAWMANASPPLHDAEYYWAGFDGASVNDTSSLVLFGKNSRGLWDVIPFVWVCRRQVEERTAADFSYAAWERQGFLRVTDGSAQDQEEIGRQIEQIAATYPIRMTACDPVGLSWLSAKFQQLGINPWGFKQNMMVQAEPIKTLWRLVENKKLCHGGQPVLRWMASNIRAVTDGSDNIKFSKKHSEDKIDGMQALANAVGIALPAMVEEDFNTNASVYEERGLVLL